MGFSRHTGRVQAVYPNVLLHSVRVLDLVYTLHFIDVLDQTVSGGWDLGLSLWLQWVTPGYRGSIQGVKTECRDAGRVVNQGSISMKHPPKGSQCILVRSWSQIVRHQKNLKNGLHSHDTPRGIWKLLVRSRSVPEYTSSLMESKPSGMAW